MPLSIRRTSAGRYKVLSPGGVKSKGTTLEKAKRQKRLLNAIENNPDFKPYK